MSILTSLREPAMNKVFNVELNFPSGSWRTVQEVAEDSMQAARKALDEYPAADDARAWMPGGPRGLDRKEVSVATRLSSRLGAEPVPRSGWEIAHAATRRMFS
jgi:hypothetical protein